MVPKFAMESLLDDLSDDEPEEGSETLTKIKGLLIQAVDLSISQYQYCWSVDCDKVRRGTQF